MINFIKATSTDSEHVRIVAPEIDYPDLRAFSVQFHPEACSGPHDTAFLFDRFCDLMGGAHHAD